MKIIDSFFEKDDSQFPDCVIFQLFDDSFFVFRNSDNFIRPEARNDILKVLINEDNYYTALGIALCNKGGLSLLDSVSAPSSKASAVFARIKNAFTFKKSDEALNAELDK